MHTAPELSTNPCADGAVLQLRSTGREGAVSGLSDWLGTGQASLGVCRDQANAAHFWTHVPLADPHTGTVPASAGQGVVANAQVSALRPHPRNSPAADGTHAPPAPTRLPPRQHPTLPDIRHTRPGSNGKHNERHQRMGRRDQGSSTTTEGAGSASGAQPFPLANRAGCSHAAIWQCNTAGAGRGFI
jgi:hypothetical protein